jgi:TIR domain
MKRVFISYADEDREFVHRIARDLIARLPEVEPTYDLLLQTEESFADTLLAEIRKADVVLAILSPDYLKSAWAEQQLNVAVERNLNGDSRLIPILYRPCEPKGFIRLLVYVDFTGNYESALTELIWGITGERPLAAVGADPGTAVIGTTNLEKVLEEERKAVTEAVERFEARPESGATTNPASETCTCFVIMPFGNRLLNEVFEDIVRPTVDRCDLHCKRGDDIFGPNIIVEDILESIRQARVVMADLTTRNANVFYEVGLCHAMDKKVLLIAQSMDDVPFDLRHHRVLVYENTPRGGKVLGEKLEQSLKVMMG